MSEPGDVYVEAVYELAAMLDSELESLGPVEMDEWWGNYQTVEVNPAYL